VAGVDAGSVLSAVLVAGYGDGTDPTKVDLTKTGETPEIKSMLDGQMKANRETDKSAKPPTRPSVFRIYTGQRREPNIAVSIS